MLTQLAPDTVSSVPARYAGIFCHGTVAELPTRAVYLSGQIGVTPEGVACDGFEAQANQAMDNVEALLSAAEMGTQDIARVVYYVTDPEFLKPLSDVRQNRWNSETPPAVTTLVVAALAAPDLLVEIEVTACQTAEASAK